MTIQKILQQGQPDAQAIAASIYKKLTALHPNRTGEELRLLTPSMPHQEGQSTPWEEQYAANPSGEYSAYTITPLSAKTIAFMRSKVKGLAEGKIRVGDNTLGAELLSFVEQALDELTRNNNALCREGKGLGDRANTIAYCKDYFESLAALINQGAEHGLFTTGNPVGAAKERAKGV